MAVFVRLSAAALAKKVVDPFSCTIYSLPPFDFGLKACKEPLKFEITSEIAFDYIKYLLFYHH